jgi:hypothetical protein
MAATAYITMMGINGTSYILKIEKVKQMKNALATWKAGWIWDMLYEKHPTRFFQLVSENKIVSFLNDICSMYYRKMEEHLRKGLNEIEANEIEWPMLLNKAGL